MKFENSNKLSSQADNLIPEQTMTMAKKASIFPTNYPKYINSASGCEVIDIDGNKFIDYSMALGVYTLGYGYKCVTDAVKKQIDYGSLFSLPNPIEVSLANEIKDIIPCAKKTRFYKNGADVTGLAVRLSRSFTSKRHLIQVGYHGHHDWYSYVLRDSGTLIETKKYTHSLNYNDLDGILESVEQNKGDTAAIIIETAFEAPENNYLEKVRDICDAENIILIFDEMWTGFRFALGGAQEYFNVTPDLATFSKGISNGYPISVITGDEKIMDTFEKIWGFTTFGGDAVPMAAALATINEIKLKNVISHIWDFGHNLRNSLNSLIKKYNKQNKIEIVGYDSRFMFKPNKFFEENKNKIQTRLIKEGILWNNMFVPSFSHTQNHLDKTVNAFDRVFKDL